MGRAGSIVIESTKAPPVPRYSNFRPATSRATAAARGSSRKRDTRCEIALRKALWRLGVRYRVAAAGLPGKPDIIIKKHHIVVFCDGDFWHGRDLETRLRKLGSGHNPSYWVAKIGRNVERDRRTTETLSDAGWTVIRLWETDILRDSAAAALIVKQAIEAAPSDRATRTRPAPRK